MTNTTFRFDRDKVFRIAFALLVATSLWLVVRMRREYRTTVAVPVKYENLPTTLKLSQPLPQRLFVSTSGVGHKLMLQALTVKNDTFRVDLALAVARGYLLTDQLRGPLEEALGMRVTTILPDSLQLQFEEKIRKRLPVVLKGQLLPADGFEFLDPPTTVPDSVEVTGTRREIESLAGWPTQAFTQQEVQGLFQRVVDLKPSDDLLVSPTTVEVRAEAARFTEGRIEVPVRKIGVPQGATVRLGSETVYVRFLVPFDRFEQVRAEDFEVTVDLSQITEETEVLVPKLVRRPAVARSVVIESAALSFVISRRR